MVYQTEKELKHGQMEENTLENLKKARKSDVDKDLYNIQMDLNLLENLKMVYQSEEEP